MTALKHHSQWAGAGGWGHAAVVEAVLTQTISQAAALHLVGSFPRERWLQLCPLRAHLLILGLNVILAVLALILCRNNHTETSRRWDTAENFWSHGDLFIYRDKMDPPCWRSESRGLRSSLRPCRCRSPELHPSAAPSVGDPPSGSPARGQRRISHLMNVIIHKKLKDPAAAKWSLWTWTALCERCECCAVGDSFGFPLCNPLLTTSVMPWWHWPPTSYFCQHHQSDLGCNWKLSLPTQSMT